MTNDTTTTWPRCTLVNCRMHRSFQGVIGCEQPASHFMQERHGRRPLLPICNDSAKHLAGEDVDLMPIETFFRRMAQWSVGGRVYSDEEYALGMLTAFTLGAGLARLAA